MLWKNTVKKYRWWESTSSVLKAKNWGIMSPIPMVKLTMMCNKKFLLLCDKGRDTIMNILKLRNMCFFIWTSKSSLGTKAQPVKGELGLVAIRAAAWKNLWICGRTIMFGLSPIEGHAKGNVVRGSSKKLGLHQLNRVYFTYYMFASWMLSTNILVCAFENLNKLTFFRPVTSDFSTRCIIFKYYYYYVLVASWTERAFARRWKIDFSLWI